ncbi:MAG: CCA tRNA nucleotidyltransferase [Phormidesmis sp. RL_2_1]|nr:CCA tRNA nucleotidyltransferase [Phormidesmis sp. RL_2_1]
MLAVWRVVRCLMFSPQTWPFPIDLLPADVYLVGGTVRDRLLNRQASYLDLDFVLPEKAVETAASIARACHAGCVVLDAQRAIARVVFDQATADFAQQQGDSLEADLQRRDFTMNAIAYHPHQQRLIDPLGGQTDIADKTIRMVSYNNLRADPLRLMRAYRQAAQLGFTVAPDTQAAIGALAPQLRQVAIERIRHELDKILMTPAGDGQLQAIFHHQLLQFCLPHFNLASLAQIAAITQAVHHFEQVLPSYAIQLHHWPRPMPPGADRSWIKTVKLSQLLGPSLAIAQAQLTALKYSRYEAQAVLTLLRVQPTIAALCQGALTRAQQFFLFKAAGEYFPAVSLLALAQGAEMTALQSMIERFLDPNDDIAHAQALITGTALMQQLNIAPGPEIGRWLQAVEQAQAEGKLHSPEDAIAWVKLQKRT